jgi:hypothetical protein
MRIIQFIHCDVYHQVFLRKRHVLVQLMGSKYEMSKDHPTPKCRPHFKGIIEVGDIA